MQVKAIFTGIGVGLYSKYETELKRSVDPNIIAGTCPNWTSMFTTDNQNYQTFQLQLSLPGCFSYCCCRNGSNRPLYDSPSVAVVLNLIQSVAFLEDTPLSTEHDHLKQQVWLTFWVKDAAKSLRTFKLLSQQKSRSDPLFISP